MEDYDSVMEERSSINSICSDYFVIQELKQRLAKALLRIEHLERTHVAPNQSFLCQHYDKLLCEAIDSNSIKAVRAILEKPDFDPEFAHNALSYAYMCDNFKIVRELLLFPSLRDYLYRIRPELDVSGTLKLMQQERYAESIEPAAVDFRMFYRHYTLEDYYKMYHRKLTVDRFPNTQRGNEQSLEQAIQSKVLESSGINI